MKYSQRFANSLSYTAQLHADQIRKGTEIPYISHLLGVASLVIENGGDEDQAIAALLHDAVEDQGGHARLAEIRQLFGEKVAMIVDGCTDAYEIPKPPWRQRKENYLQHLRTADPSVYLVSLADKVHNARSLAMGLKQNSPDFWSNFKGGKDGTIWYYEKLVLVFKEIYPGYLTDVLNDLVREIKNLSA